MPSDEPAKAFDLKHGIFGVCFSFLATIAPLPAQAGQVWFAGVDSVVAADRQRIGMSTAGASDFMDLFTPEAPWKRQPRRFKS